MDDLLMVVRFLLFFYLIYHGYKQRLIYKTDIKNNFHKNDKPTNVKPEPSNTDIALVHGLEYNETIEKLRAIMVDQKLYLDQELSLGSVANKLGIHSHQLSKILNIQLRKNFYEYVNEYRVDEFKRLAVNPKNKHISLLGLAMDAGFNSKATFNRFFKKSTGLTPSEFQEHYKF